MLDYLQKSYIKGTKVIGIEMCFQIDGSFTMNIQFLRRRKRTIKIEKKIENCSMEVFRDEISAKVPACIAVTGECIISKKIISNDGTVRISDIFPSANEDDFACQTTMITENEYYLSVIRKSYVHEIIQLFESTKAMIIDIHLGPFCINDVIPYFNEHNDVILLNNLDLHLSGNHINELIESDNREKFNHYSIGNESINKIYLIAFAVAFRFFSPHFTPNKLVNYNIYHRYTNFFCLNLLKSSFAVVFLFVCSLILINIFISKHIEVSRNDISFDKDNIENEVKDFQLVERELESLETFIYGKNLLTKYNISDVLFLIINDLPASATLESIIIQPLQKRITENQEVNLKNNCIQINGIDEDVRHFHKWINKLWQEEYFGEVIIMNYEKTGIINAEFSVEIFLK